MILSANSIFSWVWFCWTFAAATPSNHPKQHKTGAIFGDQRIVSENASSAWSVAVGDLNGDGFMDLASASKGNSQIAWYNNTDGIGTFGQQIVVSKNAVFATSVVIGDFNNDGALDLASSSQSDDKVAWYNNTDGKGTFGQQIIISTNALAAQDLAVGDFDLDGWLDLTCACDEGIFWMRNMHGPNGAGNFSKKIIVNSEISYFYSVVVGDFNRDGWPDIASASDNSIAWYKNDGTGTFGTTRIITLKAPYAFSISVGDLNGNGWPDLVSASLVRNY